jgi:anti-sigma B factor antagonist
MLEPLQWQEGMVEGVVVIAPERGLKGGLENALRERIEQLVREGHRQILIDMTRLPYVDSTELGRLIRCHLAVRQAGGRVRLCCLSDRMMTLVRVMRLDTVFDIYLSVGEAIAAIHS